MTCEPDSEPVTVTLLSIERVRGAGKLLALASVQVEIAGVVIPVHGFRVHDMGDKIVVEPPTYRDAGGRWWEAVYLPQPVLMAAGEIIRDELAAAVTHRPQSRHAAIA